MQENADEHFAFLSQDEDAMKNELTRDSAEFRTAASLCMVRPFVCLVAMGWRQRQSLCMQLGWSLLESSNFGDPHAEALEMICKSGAGILSRTNQSYEKLNPGANDADWDEVLTRTLLACFGVCRHVRSNDVADPAGRLKRPIKEVLRQKADRRARLQVGEDPRIATLEDEMLEKLWLSRIGGLSPAQRDTMDHELLHPEIHLLGHKLKRAGVTNDMAVRYFLHSAQESSKAQGGMGDGNDGGSSEAATSSQAAKRANFLSQQLQHCADGDVPSTGLSGGESNLTAQLVPRPVLQSKEVVASIAERADQNPAAAAKQADLAMTIKSPEKLVGLAAGEEAKTTEQQQKDVEMQGCAEQCIVTMISETSSWICCKKSGLHAGLAELLGRLQHAWSCKRRGRFP
eukprot:SAG31_NODE_8151_length_1509_cov_1.317730_1_plen_401_part_00